MRQKLNADPRTGLSLESIEVLSRVRTPSSITSRKERNIMFAPVITAQFYITDYGMATSLLIRSQVSITDLLLDAKLELP